MAPSFADLVDDLRSETAVLTEMLGNIAYAEWLRPTPADGWKITDQIAHLAYFDEMAALTATDPVGFQAKLVDALNDPVGVVDRVAAELRGKPADAVDVWFREGREVMIDAFAALPDGARVPWYGSEMSAASSLTARIMETWAHTQDVADALELPHQPTRAVRNVAHICARTMANSFRTRGLALPTVDVLVTLHSDSELWKWGSDASETITGDAVEFCLVCTQRRHIDDTSLVVVGGVSRQWMEIAQAFAGPPGVGRSPASPATDAM